MQRTNKVSLLLLTLVLVLGLGLAATAWGQPQGKKIFRPGPGMMNLTPDQAGKLFDLKEKFRTDTAPLRKGMLLKRLEMRDLWRAATPDEKAILAKLKEINALKEQLMEKRIAFAFEARKIAPNLGFGMGCFGMGRGFGMGHGFGRGHGFGMGHGCAMGPGGMGMGPGPMGPGMVPPPPPPAK